MEELTKEILQNSKWKVTPEQSKRLQEVAFELGYVWYCIETKEVIVINNEYLFFSEDRITHGWNEEKYFNNHKNTERKFEDYFEEKHKESIFGCPIVEKKYPKAIYKIDEPVVEITNISEEGSFMWAVEQMKQGKKVRRKVFVENNLWFINDEIIISTNTSRMVSPSLTSLESTDWEIYEEKNSLSDMLMIINPDGDIGTTSDRIKDAVKNVYDYINSGKWSLDNNGTMCQNLLNKLKEEFGDKLI